MLAGKEGEDTADADQGRKHCSVVGALHSCPCYTDRFPARSCLCCYKLSCRLCSELSPRALSEALVTVCLREQGGLVLACEGKKTQLNHHQYYHYQQHSLGPRKAYRKTGNEVWP